MGSREEERIDRILFLIGHYWRRRPDLRLGQLIHTALGYDIKFGTEDSDLEEMLRHKSSVPPLEQLARTVDATANPLDLPENDTIRRVHDLDAPELADVIGELRAGRILARHARAALLHARDNNAWEAEKALECGFRLQRPFVGPPNDGGDPNGEFDGTGQGANCPTCGR